MFIHVRVVVSVQSVWQTNETVLISLWASAISMWNVCLLKRWAAFLPWPGSTESSSTYSVLFFFSFCCFCCCIFRTDSIKRLSQKMQGGVGLQQQSNILENYSDIFVRGFCLTVAPSSIIDYSSVYRQRVVILHTAAKQARRFCPAFGPKWTYSLIKFTERAC